MAWQPHDSSNADRAVSPYEDRNVSNDVIGNTNTENAYVRNDEANAAEDPQPGYNSVTDDFGNQYKNWNANYVRHGINGEDLSPAVPISIDSEASIAGLTSTATRVGQDVTGTMATFSGGQGALTIEGRFFIDKGGDHADLANWTAATEYSTANPQTYTPAADEVGKELIFVSRAVDTQGVTAISIAEDFINIFPDVTAVSATTFTGIKQVGATLDITTATGAGGIPPLNYLIQLRFSDTGTGGWGDNQNLAGNLTAGQVVQWTIPEDKAGKYVQIRTRIRDNNGLDNTVYKQVWSIAPGSTTQINDKMTSTGDNGTITGTFQVGQTIAGDALPTFNGGTAPFNYAVKFQSSADGSAGWTDLGGPFADVGETLDPNEKTYVLQPADEAKFIRMQTEVTDATGASVIRAGTVYGPVIPA